MISGYSPGLTSLAATPAHGPSAPAPVPLLHCMLSPINFQRCLFYTHTQVLLTSNGTGSKCDLTEGVIQLLNEYYCIADFFLGHTMSSVT